MESGIIKNYQEASRVWTKAMNFAVKKAKEGVPLLELAEETELLIGREGAAPAFPINLSVNEQAAHFTPSWKDSSTLKESDLLKIDIGVHVEGCICDGARSINLDNSHAKQIEATELALQNALSIAEYGKQVEKIGAIIEKTLKEKGFNPVFNLSGHGLGVFDVHAAPSVPNHAKGSTAVLGEGAIAIEPFGSTGKGFVSETAQVEIFALEKNFGVRNATARKILENAKKYNGLPFAERWVRQELTSAGVSELQQTIALRELLRAGCLHSFHGLKETQGNLVTQAEKSALILEGKTIVLCE